MVDYGNHWGTHRKLLPPRKAIAKGTKVGAIQRGISAGALLRSRSVARQLGPERATPVLARARCKLFLLAYVSKSRATVKIMMVPFVVTQTTDSDG